jgi:hypothetical protein
MAPDDQWEVEEIVGHEMVDGKAVYIARWLGTIIVSCTKSLGWSPQWDSQVLGKPGKRVIEEIESYRVKQAQLGNELPEYSAGSEESSAVEDSDSSGTLDLKFGLTHS